MEDFDKIGEDFLTVLMKNRSVVMKSITDSADKINKSIKSHDYETIANACAEIIMSIGELQLIDNIDYNISNALDYKPMN